MGIVSWKPRKQDSREGGSDPVKHTPQRDPRGQCPLHLATTETTGELEGIRIGRWEKQEATVSADDPSQNLALKAKGGKEESRRCVCRTKAGLCVRTLFFSEMRAHTSRTEAQKIKEG